MKLAGACRDRVNEYVLSASVIQSRKRNLGIGFHRGRQLEAKLTKRLFREAGQKVLIARVTYGSLRSLVRSARHKESSVSLKWNAWIARRVFIKATMATDLPFLWPFLIFRSTGGTPPRRAAVRFHINAGEIEILISIPGRAVHSAVEFLRVSVS